MNEIKNKDFFRGGNAVFTIHNDKGDHFTFKIRQCQYDREGNKVDNGPFFVSLMTGSDNERSYSYMGIFNTKTYYVHPTKGTKVRDQKAWKVLEWGIGMILQGKVVPEGYGIKHEGKCCRCGRRLTTPKSIELGIGPECERRM